MISEVLPAWADKQWGKLPGDLGCHMIKPECRELSKSKIGIFPVVIYVNPSSALRHFPTLSLCCIPLSSTKENWSKGRLCNLNEAVSSIWRSPKAQYQLQYALSNCLHVLLVRNIHPQLSSAAPLTEPFMILSETFWVDWPPPGPLLSARGTFSFVVTHITQNLQQLKGILWLRVYIASLAAKYIVKVSLDHPKIKI